MTFTASLTSDLTSTDEIIHVDTNTGARTTYPWRAQIDDEILAVTGGVEEGLDWTVLRGADDTDPTDHASGTSVIASPLGTVTSEGHIFRDSVDPLTNPDYAPPYIQPGDLWIDTTGGVPYVHKVYAEPSGPPGEWQTAPLVAKDGLGVSVAEVQVSESGISLATGDRTLHLSPTGAIQMTLDPDTAITIGPDGVITLAAIGAGGGITLDAGSNTMYLGSLTLNGDGSADLYGPVRMFGLPTADPAVAGELWNDSGTVKVSAG